jgi:hypothetical protein
MSDDPATARQTEYFNCAIEALSNYLLARQTALFPKALKVPELIAEFNLPPHKGEDNIAIETQIKSLIEGLKKIAKTNHTNNKPDKNQLALTDDFAKYSNTRKENERIRRLFTSKVQEYIQESRVQLESLPTAPQKKKREKEILSWLLNEIEGDLKLLPDTVEAFDIKFREPAYRAKQVELSPSNISDTKLAILACQKFLERKNRLISGEATDDETLTEIQIIIAKHIPKEKEEDLQNDIDAVSKEVISILMSSEIQLIARDIDKNLQDLLEQKRLDNIGTIHGHTTAIMAAKAYLIKHALIDFFTAQNELLQEILVQAELPEQTLD